MESQNKSTKLLGISVRKFCIIYAVVILSVVILQLSVLSVNDWISQDISDSEIEWKGSLFQIYQSETFFQEDTYIELRNHWCDIADKLKQQTGNYTSPQRTFCTTFDRYKSGGQAYVAFAIINSIDMLLVILNLYLAFCLTFTKCCLITSSCLLGITNLIGIIILSASFKFVFNGNCDTLYNEEDTQPTSTCSETGPEIALIIFFIVFFLAVFTIVVACLFNVELQRFLQVSRLKGGQGFGEVIDYPPPNIGIPPHMANQVQYVAQVPQIPPQQMQMAQIPGYPPVAPPIVVPQQVPGFGVTQVGYQQGPQPVYMAVPTQMHSQPVWQAVPPQYPSASRQGYSGYHPVGPPRGY